MIKFYVISDLHLWDAERLGPNDRPDQQCVNESCAIIDAAFEKLAAKTDSDIILIAGDLTNNGEVENHKSALQKLEKLKKSGKRIFIITATHDYGLRYLDENGVEKNADKRFVSRRKLRDIYYEYGFGEAFDEHRESMSYAVGLSDECVLLCLNDDGNGRDVCGYSPSQLEWIKKTALNAKKEGKIVVAMTHHPVLPPTPIYPLFSRVNMLADFENVSRFLAESGVSYVFTGHTHMQNIGFADAPGGNRLYDINTGSLVGYPAPIRAVVLDEKGAQITTETIDKIDFDLGGKTVSEYMSGRFYGYLQTLFDSMAFDFDKFLSFSGGLSLDAETVEKKKKLIVFIGKALQRLTLGKLGKLLFCRGKIDGSVEDTTLAELVAASALNIWSGNEIYGEDSPLGAAVFAIAKRINSLFKPIIKKLPIDDFPKFVLSLVYDETPDSDAYLPLKTRV